MEQDAARQKQEIESFWGFISRSIERTVECLKGLAEDDLNWRPLENGNSLYVIATHILGTAEENVLGVLCGQSIQRRREIEFAVRAESVESIRSNWRDLQERIKRSLEGAHGACRDYSRLALREARQDTTAPRLLNYYH